MNNAALPDAEIEMEIPFHDVDMLKIVWHGHYCKYFEAARCALLDKMDYGYLTMKDTGYVWPIIDIQIRYVKPGRFGQRIRVRAELTEYEYRMKIRYRACDAISGEILAKGHTVQVAVDAHSGEMCYASPEVFLRKLANISQGSS